MLGRRQTFGYERKRVRQVNFTTYIITAYSLTKRITMTQVYSEEIDHLKFSFS